MFPDRPVPQLSRSRRAVAAGGLSALCAAADAGERFGPASQPAPRVERRVRRVSQVRAGRRPAAARLAGVRPVGPVLRQGVRGRHQPALLPGGRYQRLDGISARSGCPRSNTPGGSPGRWATWRSSKGTRSGLSCVAGGIVRNIPPRRNPSHLMAVFDVLEQTQPQGETQLVPVLHELAETIASGRLIVIISDLFVEPDELRSLLPAPAVPQARRGGLPSARPAGAGLRLSPADAVSRHGRGPVDLRRAQRDRRPLSQGARRLPRRDLQQVVLESAVDYHRVTIDENLRAGPDAVPGRADAFEGRAMSFLAADAAGGPAAGGLADHHPPDQPAAVSDGAVGGDDVSAGGQPDVARLCPAAAVADHGDADGGDRRLGLRRQPAARGGWLGLAAGGRRRHDDRRARPLAQHAAGGAERGGSKLETGVRQLVAHARDARLGALGLDRRARPTSRASWSRSTTC